jgi:ankyrin repeat protein
MIKKYNNINNENAIILHLIKTTSNKKTVDEFNNNIIHLTILKGNPCLLFNILNELKYKNELENLINSRNSDGDTPLHLAIKFLNQKLAKEVIDILLYFKADVNIKDMDGNIIIWNDKPKKQNNVVNNQSGGGNKKNIFNGIRKL